MKATIKPSQLKEISRLRLPRARCKGLVRQRCWRRERQSIYNPGHSNDDKAALDIIQRLGATINQISEEQLQVVSEGVNPIASEINCGESGLSIRMFTPLVALSDKEITINGAGSLATRPMDFLIRFCLSLESQ